MLSPTDGPQTRQTAVMFFRFICVWGGSYLCQMGMDAHVGQKRPSDPLELELLPNVGAENRIQLTWKSSKHFEPPF